MTALIPYAGAGVNERAIYRAQRARDARQRSHPPLPEIPPSANPMERMAAIAPSQFIDDCPTMSFIIDTVCAFYFVNRRDLISARRTADVILPRHVALYLSHKLTLNASPAVGRYFGGRDPTTVLHACRKIAQAIAADPAFATDVRAVERALLERRI